MLYNTSHLPSLMRYGLSFQHFIAVFFATILTSLILGLPVPVAMFFSGLSTLFYHYFTNGKIPQYISTSMQGITGMLFVKQMCMAKGMPEDLALCYTLFGGFVIGVIYIIFSAMLKFISQKTISKILPPALVGSLIMVIGIQLFVSALYTIKGGILTGTVTVAAILVIELLLKGRYRVMSINVGLLAGLLVALGTEGFDLSLVGDAKWLDFPFDKQFMAFRVLEWWDREMIAIVILTVIPIAITTIGEHVADLITISETTKKDYLKTIGLPQTIGANGMTSIMASVFGAPQNTTYTETTGLIQINRTHNGNDNDCAFLLPEDGGIVRIYSYGGDWSHHTRYLLHDCYGGMENGFCHSKRREETGVVYHYSHGDWGFRSDKHFLRRKHIGVPHSSFGILHFFCCRNSRKHKYHC